MFALLGCSDVVVSLIRKYGDRSNIRIEKAHAVAWCTALAPSMGVNREKAVRLASVAVKELSADIYPALMKTMALKTLGDVLFRRGSLRRRDSPPG